jgi:hypothetical protein
MVLPRENLSSDPVVLRLCMAQPTKTCGSSLVLHFCEFFIDSYFPCNFFLKDVKSIRG